MTALINAEGSPPGRVPLDLDHPLVVTRGCEIIDHQNKAQPIAGYKPLKKEEYFEVHELRSAADNLLYQATLADGSKENRVHPFNETSMRRKIAAQLDTMIEKNQEYAVLSAFGCGAFGNPPERVAQIYKEELEKRPGAFKGIKFAILGESNVNVFKRELNGFTLTASPPNPAPAEIAAKNQAELQALEEKLSKIEGDSAFLPETKKLATEARQHLRDGFLAFDVLSWHNTQLAHRQELDRRPILLLWSQLQLRDAIAARVTGLQTAKPPLPGRLAAAIDLQNRIAESILNGSALLGKLSAELRALDDPIESKLFATFASEKPLTKSSKKIPKAQQFINEKYSLLLRANTLIENIGGKKPPDPLDPKPDVLRAFIALKDTIHIATPEQYVKFKEQFNEIQKTQELILKRDTLRETIKKIGNAPTKTTEEHSIKMDAMVILIEIDEALKAKDLKIEKYQALEARYDHVNKLMDAIKTHSSTFQRLAAREELSKETFKDNIVYMTEITDKLNSSEANDFFKRLSIEAIADPASRKEATDIAKKVASKKINAINGIEEIAKLSDKYSSSKAANDFLIALSKMTPAAALENVMKQKEKSLTETDIASATIPNGSTRAIVIADRAIANLEDFKKSVKLRGKKYKALEKSIQKIEEIRKGGDLLICYALPKIFEGLQKQVNDIGIFKSERRTDTAQRLGTLKQDLDATLTKENRLPESKLHAAKQLEELFVHTKKGEKKYQAVEKAIHAILKDEKNEPRKFVAILDELAQDIEKTRGVFQSNTSRMLDQIEKIKKPSATEDNSQVIENPSDDDLKLEPSHLYTATVSDVSFFEEDALTRDLAIIEERFQAIIRYLPARESKEEAHAAIDKEIERLKEYCIKQLQVHDSNKNAEQVMQDLLTTATDSQSKFLAEVQTAIQEEAEVHEINVRFDAIAEINVRFDAIAEITDKTDAIRYELDALKRDCLNKMLASGQSVDQAMSGLLGDLEIGLDDCRVSLAVQDAISKEADSRGQAEDRSHSPRRLSP